MDSLDQTLTQLTCVWADMDHKPRLVGDKGPWKVYECQRCGEQIRITSLADLMARQGQQLDKRQADE